MSENFAVMFIREWGVTKTAQVVLSAIAFACIGFIISSTFIPNENIKEEEIYEY